MNISELKEKLAQLGDKVIETDVVADNRITLSCESENSYEICRFLFEDVGARFVIATGIDADECYEVIYHFSYDQTGCMINVKALIRDRENPEIESITPIVTAAEWIERELYDVLGINIKNHPRLERLILSDDWKDDVHPLRKDAL